MIVGAVHILDSVCDDLPETRYEYTNQFYVLNGTLGTGSMKVARLLEDQGYRAIPIPAAYPRINKELMGVFSHRHAAVLAGLGEIRVQQSSDHPSIWRPGPIGFHHYGSEA